MKKNLFLAALAVVALASCTSDEFTGDPTIREANENGAISFSSGTPAITRASGGDAATALGYKFKVYGVKKVGSNYSNVFATGEYSTDADYNADPYAYWAWYKESTSGKTTSNTANWDYVGTAGSYGTSGHEATVGSGKDQTIKYWDYGADQYEFVAYSATVGSPTITKYQKDGFTVNATAAELAGLYVADKLTISAKNNTPTTPATGTNQIGNIVQFTFRSAAAKVRLGIYETIPGFVVNNVKFRPNGIIDGFSEPSTNARLSGSFNGTSSSGSGTYNVTYNSSGNAVFANQANSTSGYFDFGTITYVATTEALGNGLKISSTDPTWASGSSDYQSVLPNTESTKIGNMVLYVDYDLFNSKSGETIHVKGAKAVVPKMYMTWNPNFAYTYLFKISDNTNGTTGTEGTSPAGLYPITFDALTIAATDGQQVGTITTVSTPTITTYQKGSVSNSGITYATASSTEPIYITVTNNSDGSLITLTTENAKLYKLAVADANATEADLISSPTKLTSATDLSSSLTILSGAQTVQGIAFAANTTATFTPSEAGTYAFEYISGSNPAVKSYKVIKVASGS